jgi:hypothetical protein
LQFDIYPVPYVCPCQHWKFVLCSPRQTNSPIDFHRLYFTHTCLHYFYTSFFFGGGGRGKELKIYKNIVTNGDQQYAAIFICLFLVCCTCFGQLFAHHQEHITVFTAAGIVHRYWCWLVSWIRWNCRYNCNMSKSLRN